MSPSPHVKIDQLSVRYQAHHPVLEKINLAIEKGEIFVLLGASGCGKTTLLKSINRLISPHEGQIYFNGKNIQEIAPVMLRRQIGYVVQSIGLLPHYTVEENISLVPRLLKWKAEKTRQRTRELLSLMGLDATIYAERYPSNLSGGQQQRVGFARALAAEQKLLLLDEPFAALDQITRAEMQDLLLQIRDQFGVTCVVVTHDIMEAFKLADRIAVIENAVLSQIGPAAELASRPATPFIEELIQRPKRDVRHLSSILQS